jgi:hypothetical protein
LAIRTDLNMRLVRAFDEREKSGSQRTRTAS